VAWPAAVWLPTAVKRDGELAGDFEQRCLRECDGALDSRGDYACAGVIIYTQCFDAALPPGACCRMHSTPPTAFFRPSASPTAPEGEAKVFIRATVPAAAGPNQRRVLKLATATDADAAVVKMSADVIFSMMAVGALIAGALGVAARSKRANPPIKEADGLCEAA